MNRTIKLLLSQFATPLILLLLACATFLFFYQDRVDALIILAIVLVSGLLGFWQEFTASKAVEKLLSMVQVKTSVIRDGKLQEIPMEQVVPGDIALFSAGNMIPGDGKILEANHFFVDEATLTGEAFPAEKGVDGSVFMGTHVVSGTAKVLITLIGKETLFGKTTASIARKRPETDFEKGVTEFGYFLLRVTFALVFFIFAFNLYLERPFLESFLFSLALAVGLTPQLLPAIISINLAHGAKYMAKKDVIVRRLASIENFGSMNILCSDKTGTLTTGELRLLPLNGEDKLALYGYLNAFFQKGYVNPIDTALIKSSHFDTSGFIKKGEIPYDFLRKRLSVALSHGKETLLITKGAFKKVLEVCQNVDVPKAQKLFEELSNEGFRVIAVAYKEIEDRAVTPSDEKGMTLLGLLVFEDPIKEDVAETIAQLKSHGVSLKIITGDNQLVAKHIARKLFTSEQKILTGAEITSLSDHALAQRVQHTAIFAEIEPNQKERLILALRKTGKNVVGYIGDGINDVSAMYAADVSISVDSGADSAKEVADIVLLKKSLSVLLDGVKMGRMTFANTMKYVWMATSANFGNMFSMAGASLFLSFLPLLPKQVLFTNLLTDLPEMAIATDKVDIEMIRKPLRWDVNWIRKFMLTFGLISSIFDYLTFGVLLYFLKATPELFRTGWFLESVISATLIVLVIRTRRPFFKSMPSLYLLLATLFVIGFVLIIPLTPLIAFFDFTPLPAPFFIALGAILALYIVTVEFAKKCFYK